MYMLYILVVCTSPMYQLNVLVDVVVVCSNYLY